MSNITIRSDILTEIHTITDEMTRQNTFSESNIKKLFCIDHCRYSYEFGKSLYFMPSKPFGNSFLFSNSYIFSKSNQFSQAHNFC